MKHDPIVAEIRKNRARLTKKFGGDVRGIIKDAQQRQHSSKRRLVDFSKKANKAAA